MMVVFVCVLGWSVFLGVGCLSFAWLFVVRGSCKWWDVLCKWDHLGAVGSSWLWVCFRRLVVVPMAVIVLVCIWPGFVCGVCVSFA